MKKNECEMFVYYNKWCIDKFQLEYESYLMNGREQLDFISVFMFSDLDCI